MIIIPITAVPNQTFEIILNKQDCLIRLFTRNGKMFMDLIAEGNPVVAGAICEDRTYIIQLRSKNFTGNLFFIDTIGNSSPQYTLLNSRYLLFYKPPEELK